MNADKLRERTKSLALRTLAAIEAVEHRVAHGEIGAAIGHAAQQLRGALDALRDLDEPSGRSEGFIDGETKQLIVHLDARVTAIEKRIAVDPAELRELAR